jgi:hypothetical protein
VFCIRDPADRPLLAVSRASDGADDAGSWGRHVGSTMQASIPADGQMERQVAERVEERIRQIDRAWLLTIWT